MGSFVDFFLLLCVLCLRLYTSQEIRHEVDAHHGAIPGRITFSRELLLSLRSTTDGVVPVNIPPELHRPNAKFTRRKGGGVRRRLKNMGLPALPTILLSNVQSIRNKLDELEAWATFKHEVKDTCLLAFTEMWLSDQDRDENLSLRVQHPISTGPVTNKRRGGVVCLRQPEVL